MAEFDETGVEIETSWTTGSTGRNEKEKLRIYPPTVIPAEAGYFVYEFDEGGEGDADLHTHSPVLAWIVRPVLTAPGSSDFRTPLVVPVVLDRLLVSDRFYVYRCPDGVYRYDGFEIGRTQEEAGKYLQSERKAERDARIAEMEARKAEREAATSEHAGGGGSPQR